MSAQRIIAAFSLALTFTAPAFAQNQLSPEADQAFWCAAAFAMFANKGGFASLEQQNAALADLGRFEAVVNAEAARFGWVESDAVNIANSYGEEVGPQVEDYLRWREPAALRLNLADCFPNVPL